MKSSEPMDMLQLMWLQQHNFVKLLQQRRSWPIDPLDLTQKENQRFLKSITHDCMDELYEANKELKNSKQHRQMNITEFDRVAYVEELIDAQHFLFEIAIMSGVTAEEFFAAYMKKGMTNVARIEMGY